MVRKKYERRPRPGEDCPNKDKHTDAPYGYVAWMEWAEEMSKTHNQVECPGCGLWIIWIPKQSEWTIDRTNGD